MRAWKPSAEAIRSIVEVLTDLEKRPTKEWDRGEPDDEGVLAMPSLPLDDVESKFMHRAYEHGWVFEFDWGEWQDEAERYDRTQSYSVLLTSTRSVSSSRRICERNDSARGTFAPCVQRAT